MANVMRRGDSAVEGLLDLVSVAISVAVVLTLTIGISGALRVVPVLLFIFFVPGHAMLRVLPYRVRSFPRLESSRSVVVMPIVLSLSLSALVASVALWLHVWHPYAIFAFEADASFILIAAGYINKRMT